MEYRTILNIVLVGSLLVLLSSSLRLGYLMGKHSAIVPIAMSDKPPDDPSMNFYLVWVEHRPGGDFPGHWDMAYWLHDRWNDDEARPVENVTHYLPLPPAPTPSP